MFVSSLASVKSSLVMAFPVWLGESSHGNRTEDTAAGDLFVLAHLGFFFLLLGCFAWAAWSIWKRTTQPPPHIQLLMELTDDETPASVRSNDAPAATSPASEPWEKPADWWK